MISGSDSNKDFGRFKGEFFAINEVILNKDLNLLKLATVKQQRAKQLKLIEKISMMELNVGSNSTGMEALKDRYDQF